MKTEIICSYIVNVLISSVSHLYDMLNEEKNPLRFEVKEIKDKLHNINNSLMSQQCKEI